MLVSLFRSRGACTLLHRPLLSVLLVCAPTAVVLARPMNASLVNFVLGVQGGKVASLGLQQVRTEFTHNCCIHSTCGLL